MRSADSNQKVNVPSEVELSPDQAIPKSEMDRYIEDQLKDMTYNMKAVQVPKGVWFSTFVMSFPLVACLGYSALMAPMAANAAIVDPNQFGYMVRSSLRLLSLNISFFGGIHYGLGSA